MMNSVNANGIASAAGNTGWWGCSLFQALDCADLVSIDGCALGHRYAEVGESVRVIQLANETELTIADQEIRIRAGEAQFADLQGLPHRVHFAVERSLDEADLIDTLT